MRYAENAVNALNPRIPIDMGNASARHSCAKNAQIRAKYPARITAYIYRVTYRVGLKPIGTGIVPFFAFRAFTAYPVKRGET